MGVSNNLTGLFLAVIAVSAFTISALMFLDGGAQTYGISYDHTVFSALQQQGTISNLTKDTEQTLVGANSSSGASGGSIINTITTAGYQSFSLITAVPHILYVMFTAIAIVLNIPYPIVLLSFCMIVVTIISVIILLVFRVQV